MNTRKPKSVIFVQWFGVVALVIAAIQTLLSHLFNKCVGILQALQMNGIPLSESIEPLFDFLKEDYFSISTLLSTTENALGELAKLIPFVLFLVYLFFLYRNNRHNILLPLSLLITLGITSLYFFIYSYQLFEQLPDMHYGISGVIAWIGTRTFAFSSYISLLLWIAIVFIMLIDCFTKFRLRWISIASIVTYIVATICLPLAIFFSYYIFDSATHGFRSMLNYILVISAFNTTPSYAALNIAQQIVNIFIGLLPAFTYLLFWICGAKRVKKAVPAAEIVE